MTSFPAGCCPTTHDAGPRSCRRRRSARSGLGRRHGNRTRPAALRLTGRCCLGAGARERSDNAPPTAELSRSQTTSVPTVYETEQTCQCATALHGGPEKRGRQLAIATAPHANLTAMFRLRLAVTNDSDGQCRAHHMRS